MNEPTQTTIVYKGRKDADSHAYIRQDTGQTIHFGRRLQKHHEIGGIYRAEISPTDKENVWTYSTFGARAPEGEPVGMWSDPQDVADWTRQDAQVGHRLRQAKEHKGLEAAARKAARTIKPQYDRASIYDRIKMVKAVVEELEK